MNTIRSLAATTASARRPASARLFAALVAAGLAASTPSAFAANGADTWVGNTSASFSGLNWTGTNTPPINGDSWVFGAAGTAGMALTNDLTAAMSVAGITFNLGADAFTIGGNSITLTGNVANNSTSLQTLSTAITTTAVRSFTTSAGGGDLAVTGGISGASGGVTKAGNGTLTLSNANSYTGATMVSAGTLNLTGSLTGNTAITTSGTGVFTQGSAGVISGSSTFTQGSSGTSVLSGANTYTGATTIGAGSLTLNRATGSLGATALTFNGQGGTFAMDNIGASGALSQSLGALTFSAGEGTVNLTRSTAFDQILTFASLSRSAGATANLVLGGTASATNKITTSNPTSGGNTANTGNVNNQGIFFGGSDYARIDATKGFHATVYGTDGNALGVIGGGTTFGPTNGSNDIQVTGAITAQTTASVNTIKLTSANPFTLATGATLSVNGLLKTGGTAALISGGTGLQAQLNAELGIRTDLVGDSLNLNTSVLANGSNALTKSGAGTLVLGSANTYTGVTTVNQGTLALANQNAIQNSTLTLSGGTVAFDSSVSANAFTFGGLAATGAGVGYNLALQNNAGSPAAVALTVGGNNATSTYAGVLSGTGSLTKVGTGTLNLTGVNTLTGAVTVNNGGLKFSNSGTAFLSTPSAFNLAPTAGNTATLAIEGMNNFVNSAVTNGISVSGAATGTAILEVSGLNNTFSGGAINLVNHDLTISHVRTSSGGFSTTITNAVTGSGNLTLQENITNTGGGGLTVSGAQNQTGTITANTTGLGGTAGFYTTTLSGNLGAGISALTVNNTTSDANGKKLALNGSNTAFTGTATVTAGTLQIGNAAALNVNNTVTVGGSGTTPILDLNGNALTIAGLNDGGFATGTVTNSSATAKTLTLGGSGSYSFRGTITASTPANLSLIKTGTGTQILAGNNSYTGTTTISGGTLALGINNAIAASSDISVTAGTFDLKTFSEAAKSLTMSSGTTLKFDLSTAGINSPTALLALTGNLTKSGTGTFNLDFSNQTFSTDNTYTLTSFTGTTFAATDFTLGGYSVANGESLSLSIVGNALMLTASAIPEPATYAALAGLGILGFAACRRRRA